MKYLFIFLLISSLEAQEIISLKEIKSIALSIPEPSDVAVSFDGKSLFIVSDHGGLYETDWDGKVLRSTTTNLVDAEGVYADEQYVYVVEERNRFIKKYLISDFSLVSTNYIPYEGGRNKSFEGITKTNENQYLLFTEKEPVWMFILDKDLKEISRTQWNVPGDVSSACWNSKSLWLLSDEKAELWLTDWKKGTIIKRYKLPVLNPEGLAFLPDGRLLILSDDGHRLYFFNDPKTSSYEVK